MKRVIILGTGLVGSFIANKLFEEGKLEVSTADINENKKLNKFIMQYGGDLSDTRVLENTIRTEDIIVNALPGFLGYQTLKTCIEMGKTIVDFSFMPEDFLELDELAKANNAVAVCDFGFAPGICHMWAKRLEMLGADSCKIYVCGLPKKESLEYKAVFSPIDVIEEYTRPARYKKNNKVLTEEPFKKSYIYKLKGKTLFGFISDGLRSLLKTSKLNSVVEYTLRYKKHFEKVKYLKEDGFFDKENLSNTAKLLINKWKMTDKIKDFSFLEVVGYGGGAVKHKVMYDEHDGTNHSMARATGLPVCAMVNLIADGETLNSGVYAPEHIAEKNNLYISIIQYLKDNGIEIKE